MAISPKEMERVANTVVGESILIAGKLEGDEDLTVRGRVHGSITLTRTLIVEQSGVVKADATVRNAIISGVVVGNITATESVELTREGRMVGDIRAPRVIIVDGAAFRGRVDMGTASGERVERPARPQTAPAPRATTSSVVRPLPLPTRTPPAPPRPPANVAAPSRPAPPKPPEVRPPAPPPPPKVAAPVESKQAPAEAPNAAALAKRKVIVKRKK